MQIFTHNSMKIHNSFLCLNSFFELPILTMARSPLPPSMVYVNANTFKTIASLTETILGDPGATSRDDAIFSGESLL